MRKRSILTIFRFLLLLLTVMPFCYAIFIQIKQGMIQARMKEKAETSLLHKISLNEAEVHWVKYGKEIIINGLLFDIKSYVVENRVATFHGLFDNEETALFDQIKKDHQNNTGNKQIVNLFKFLHTLYNNSSEPALILKPALCNKYPEDLSSSLLNPFISRFFPPPQI